MENNFVITGEVKPGFEAVRDAFEKQYQDSPGERSQVCVYHNGIKVVDLCGSPDGDEYNADSIQTVFSSTKSVAAIVFACLVDQGLVEYNEKIAKYWPEFGGNGKGDITVAQLLRHEAGLAKWSGMFKLEDVSTDNIKKNAIGKVIEEEAAVFPDGDTKREYHGLTRGWILNEIFRRVEPKGRTIGEYLRSEIAGPLDMNVHIGAPDSGKRNADLTTVKPKVVDADVSKYMKENAPSAQATEDRKMIPIEGQENLEQKPGSIKDLMDCLTMRAGEGPSFNGACSARGLAKLGLCILNGGELDGVRILSAETCKKLMADPVSARDAMMMSSYTHFTQGGVNVFQPHPNDPDYLKGSCCC